MTERTYRTAHGPVTPSVHIDEKLVRKLESDVCDACRGADVECRFCGGMGNAQPPEDFVERLRKLRLNIMKGDK